MKVSIKKILLAITALFSFNVSLVFGLQTISIATNPVPHAELLEFVKPKLLEQGIELKIHVFNDYVQPNLQVANGKIDANFMNHIPYLAEVNAARNINLVNVGNIHIEPFGMYSKKINSLDGLPNGGTVAIPNDPSNGGRALLLLQQAGVIKLKDGIGIIATVKDIVDNPKNIKIRELESATLPRVLGQVDAALINTNYALEAKLNPLKDALLIENSSSPYVNIVCTLPERAKEDWVQKIVAALQTEEVANFINEKYQGAVVPAFNTEPLN